MYFLGKVYKYLVMVLGYFPDRLSLQYRKLHSKKLHNKNTKTVAIITDQKGIFCSIDIKKNLITNFVFNLKKKTLVKFDARLLKPLGPINSHWSNLVCIHLRINIKWFNNQNLKFGSHKYSLRIFLHFTTSQFFC